MKFKNPVKLIKNFRKRIKERRERKVFLEKLRDNIHDNRKSIFYAAKLVELDPGLKKDDTKSGINFFKSYYDVEKNYGKKEKSEERFNKLLEFSFHSEETWLRKSSITLLAELEEKGIAGHLSTLLWDEMGRFEIDSEIAKTAIQTLGKIKGDDSIKCLFTLLRNNKYPELQDELMNAIADCTKDYSDYNGGYKELN